MANMYRIFEIGDKGQRTVAGWGDHASIADARRTVERWGKVLAFELDTDHDAVDALVLPSHGLGAVQIVIEPLRDETAWPTH